MIKKIGNVFYLATDNTSYLFRILPSGQLEHLHYGARLHLPENEDMSALMSKKRFVSGCSIGYSKEYENICLEELCLEYSSMGKGDVREPLVEAEYADGSRTLNFTYDTCLIEKGKLPFETLPGSYDEKNQVDHLRVVLQDDRRTLQLELHYYVYENCNVITKMTRLVNEGDEDVILHRLLSNQLDFHSSDYVLTTFTGAWAREMHREDMKLQAGLLVSGTVSGTSSNHANPFVMLSKNSDGTGAATEDEGQVYGCNLIYSGNHYEAAEVSAYGKLRFVSGIHPRGFQYLLKGKEAFEAPEAVMTFSKKGFNGMSRNMHDFVNEHIVRGEWKQKERPVLLNSWEANYFNINEEKLCRLAKKASQVGIELFVMDDGWFGNRDNDRAGLGDWDANPKKLPGGIEGLAKKINAMGLDFGLWVEPEMVNTDSELYRTHPEWVMEHSKQPHSEGRNQRILDLSQTEVQEFLIEKMSEVFRSGNISYVKWDMNRIFSDAYSKKLSRERQGELTHRYQLGLYRVMDELVKRFPHILFEGCSSGGNRFDLGILCYFPQIWTSDNTDALCRSEIQHGCSYGYPLSVMGAHVSDCPNHQTLRRTPMESRFQIAAFGVLGYELNLCDLKKEELMLIREQIALYKKWRSVLQYGYFYRGRFGAAVNGALSGATDYGSNHVREWNVVSRDGKKAVAMRMEPIVIPNLQDGRLYLKGLLPEKEYHVHNRRFAYRLQDFGSLVNMLSPIHLKQDSLLLKTAEAFVKLENEEEAAIVTGDMLMECGMALSPAFGGNGYEKGVRVMWDFSTGMYFAEC